MSTLVVADHNNLSLDNTTLRVIAAAKEIGQPITVLVAGHNATAVAQQSAIVQGVQEVIHLNDAIYEHPSAENLGALIASMILDYSYVLAAASSTGRNIMSRLAGILDTPLIADVIQVKGDNIFVRPYHAGALIVEVQSLASRTIMTIRPTSFEPILAMGGNAQIKTGSALRNIAGSEFVAFQKTTATDRPELVNAQVVVSGGRALGSADEFQKFIEPLADRLGAAIGASRAAVDAGYAPNDSQVGQTGRVVAPELYVAIGISGQIQHLAGMKDSRIIVAVNIDSDAPIFTVADYGLVADYKNAIPEIIAALPKPSLAGSPNGKLVGIDGPSIVA